MYDPFYIYLGLCQMLKKYFKPYHVDQTIKVPTKVSLFTFFNDYDNAKGTAIVHFLNKYNKEHS